MTQYINISMLFYLFIINSSICKINLEEYTLSQPHSFKYIYQTRLISAQFFIEIFYIINYENELL